jgi:CheY-like chemotaxis protein
LSDAAAIAELELPKPQLFRDGTPGEEASPLVARQRILVADDSEVTQDLLKLLLSQRGHEVDVVSDGEEALKALRNHDYDVVLMDFHLPGMDGLEVAAAYRSSGTHAKEPRFIAITADMKGLLAHAENCENFDQFIPKPFDLSAICRVVEGETRGPRRPDVKPPKPPKKFHWPKFDDDVAMRPSVTRAREPATQERRHVPWAIRQLAYRFLHCPEDLGAARRTLEDVEYDAVLVHEAMTDGQLTPLWQGRSLHTLPIIDLAGSLGAQADLDASKLNAGDADAIKRLVEDFRERRERIHRDLLMSDELGEKLLAHLFVADRPLTAAYAPNEPGLIRYNVTLEAVAATREAELLRNSGFLSLEFVDRLHVCDRCGSSRFNVREECPDCCSSNLSEEAYLHHFKCAYQGLESDFRQGDALICPKCRKELSHFSVDYDKPGTMVKCADCGHTTSEPQVGFVCLDCGIHSLADAVRTRDMHSFALTERGRAFLETGRSLLGHSHRGLRIAELPLELIVALNGAFKHHEEARLPFTLLDIAYQNEREIERERGLRAFNQARDLFLEMLRQVLPKSAKVVKGRSSDFALISGVEPSQARLDLAGVPEQATDKLNVDLGATIDFFGAEDFT